LESFDVKVFLPNQRISIPINNVPGGEYTLSISLPFHQTQKGIKVVIPSNDTIATEEIQLSVVQSVVTIGDVTGKVLIKDRNGNILPLDTGLQIRVKALGSDIDLSGTIITGTGVDAVTSSPVQAELSTNAFIAELNGVYTIRM